MHDNINGLVQERRNSIANPAIWIVLLCSGSQISVVAESLASVWHKNIWTWEIIFDENFYNVIGWYKAIMNYVKMNFKEAN